MVDAARSSGPRDLGDPPSAGRARVAVVEAVDVGEQHEQVGADEVGDEGGEPVVVAEADLVVATVSFSLTTGHDAQLEQPVQGAVGVAVVGAAASSRRR